MEQLNLGIENNGGCEGKNAPLATDKSQPLAARLRPRNLDEFAGQRHILGKGKLLRRAIEADRFTSILLHGPPGVGKTTLAEIISQSTNCAFTRLSGVISTVADIRREIAAASARKEAVKRNTILFIDEIHRFNKAQQDALLPDVESGTVRLIGATTENPYFYVIGPLVSRSLLFQLEPLSTDDIKSLLIRALKDERGLASKNISIDEKAMDFFCDVCEGDARKALGALEIAATTTPPNENGVVRINLETAEESVQKKALIYGDDGHYDTASALHKKHARQRSGRGRLLAGENAQRGRGYPLHSKAHSDIRF